MEALLEGLATLGVGVAIFGGAIWLYRHPSRQWLEETFGHLRARREVPDQTYRLDEVMEEASKWL